MGGSPDLLNHLFGIKNAMENPISKLVTGLAFFTAGLILLSVGSRLLLFLGLVMIVISELFTLRTRSPGARISAGFVALLAACIMIGIAFKDGPVPLALLVAFWVTGIAEELFWWRRRRLT